MPMGGRRRRAVVGGAAGARLPCPRTGTVQEQTLGHTTPRVHALRRVASGRLGRHRSAVQALIDVAAWGIGLWASILIRFEFDPGGWPASQVMAAWFAVGSLQLVAGVTQGLYRRRWRFGSFEETAALASVVLGVAGGLVVASRGFVPAMALPLSVAIACGPLALLAMSVSRYCWRFVVDRALRPSPDTATKVLVFGAGEAGTQLVSTMLRTPDSPYFPAALLDDDPAKRHLRVLGVPVVGGREAIARAVADTGARHLLIAVPNAGGDLVRELSNLALAEDLAVSVLPRFEGIIAGEISMADVRPLEPRDLLGRHEITTDVDQIAGYVSGRRILVTGAGGSIGSELCRQLHRFGPARLVMLDRDESALHAVQLSIEGRALLESRDVVVADIRDRERVFEVFAEHRPDVVFHAAALKHLPLLELYPEEGWKTNVAGTRHLLEAAIVHDVERFVNISTDKAADPTSVLGRTKRTAERLTAHAASLTDASYLSVRFGNVLGSRGSVLEAFRRQLDAGGPLTVTHPDVTRYFMLVEEAVQLVVQAGAIGRPGEALVLDMGSPVRIDDVAKRLAAEAPRRIEIVYTGLRPGEKLHEVLLGADEADSRPSHPSISHVAVPAIDPTELGLPPLERRGPTRPATTRPMAQPRTR